MKRFQYKWVIIAVCTLMVFACLGFGNSAKSLFVGPVSEALEVKRSLFSLSDTIRFLATAAANMFFGKLILRFGAKKLIMAGFMCVAAAFVIFSTATSVYVYFIGSLLNGAGLAFTTTTMVGAVVNKWFDNGRGTVMGFVLASSGAGGALATQVLSPMIFEEGNPLGYKNAYMLTAILVAVCAVIALIFFRENPKDEIDPHHHDPKAKKRQITWQGIEYSQALKKPYYYVTLVLVFLAGVAIQGMSGSAATHIKDLGFDSSFTSMVLSLSLVALTFSKFFVGFIYDRTGLRFTVTLCSAAGITVMLLLAFLQNNSMGKILSVIYAIINSLALPMETVLIPLYASDLLGERSFNKAMGSFAAVNTAGFALGAPIINACFDRFDSYANGFLLFAAAMTVVLVGFQFVITQAHKERESLK